MNLQFAVDDEAIVNALFSGGENLELAGLPTGMPTGMPTGLPTGLPKKKGDKKGGLTN